MILAAVGVREKQDALFAGRADRDEPLLVPRMIRIVERECGRIGEHRRGLVERYLVLLEIRRGLLRIPFVDHVSILTTHQGFVILDQPDSYFKLPRQYDFAFKSAADLRHRRGSA